MYTFKTEIVIKKDINNIKDVIDVSKRTGNMFFDPNLVKAYNMEIYPTVVKVANLIAFTCSLENNPQTGRYYNIMLLAPNGLVYTLYTYYEKKALNEAFRKLRRCDTVEQVILMAHHAPTCHIGVIKYCIHTDIE